MGYYLDSTEPFRLYQSTVKNPYFVDKSAMLAELLPLAEAGNNHICITRPRRFGKSVAAAMIGAFFTKGIDASGIFDGLQIAEHPQYRDFLNQYHVIYINFLNAANESGSYEEFITMVKDTMQEDVREGFPLVRFRKSGTVTQDLTAVTDQTGEKFILIMDEWDCIFHKKYTTDDNRRDFINYLSALTKDAGYLALTYMTGVLPIAKYSSGSSINHFKEYTLSSREKFGTFFGFTREEVDTLYEEYLANETNPGITREDLDYWYDGYSTVSGEHIYNPRSLICALSDNQIASYWTQTGTYNEIAPYIVNDVADVKEDIARMVTGERVRADIDEYAAAAMELNTRDEIFSAMVVYGFLNYEKGYVSIPNHELRLEFARTIKREPSMGYVNRLAKASDAILRATLEGDEDAVAGALADVHKDTPILAYNSEAELATIVYFAYLSALDTYEIRREAAAGRGYADFIFLPRDGKKDGIIIELKKDKSPEEAISQIKDRLYADAFRGRIGEKKWNGKRILAVGIAYDSASGEHRCKIEELTVE